MKRAYVIAEAGVNHGGNPSVAVDMVKAAARGKCDAIKFQVYDPSKLATEVAPAYWDTKQEPTLRQRDLFEQHAGLTRHHYQVLRSYCTHVGIDLICSVFHPEDVPWLARIVDQFKIASADITNLPLLDAVAATGKPALLSTGASNMGEIGVAQSRFQQVTLLHCTLSYPTAIGEANLSAIEHLKRFGHPVGYSDHTLPGYSPGVILAAYALGATTIEKHFTLTPEAGGNDHYHALTAEEFQILRLRLDMAHEAIGSGGKRVLACELPAREGARRSITTVGPIPAGSPVTTDMVTLKRPGTGLQVLPYGARAAKDIPPDTTITSELIM